VGGGVQKEEVLGCLPVAIQLCGEYVVSVAGWSKEEDSSLVRFVLACDVVVFRCMRCG